MINDDNPYADLVPGPNLASTGSIKGAALKGFLEYYSANFGIQSLNEKIRSLDPATQELVGGSNDDFICVFSMKWYPAEAIHALLDKLFFGMPSPARSEFIKESAEHIMDQTLKGMYRHLFSTMMSPRLYALLAQTLWSRYYDSGTITKKTIEKNVHQSSIVDWSSHHPVICDLNYESSRCIYEAMGCKNVVSSRTGCVSRGDETCTFTISWGK